jgi:uncharacterized protein
VKGDTRCSARRDRDPSPSKLPGSVGHLSGDRTNAEPVVAVRGEGLLEVDPEIAVLRLTVTAKDVDQQKTLRHLDERAGNADKVLSEFGTAVAKVETSGLRVGPQFKLNKGQEKIHGFSGVVRYTVTVVDFDRLGEIMARLAELEMSEIAGPSWELRPDSPVHRRARLEAVNDAVRRATDYAEALGSHVTALVELIDGGMSSDSNGPAFASRRMSRRVAASAPLEEFSFDITPVKQWVRATVEARFKMTAPDLTAGPGPG